MGHGPLAGGGLRAAALAALLAGVDVRAAEPGPDPVRALQVRQAKLDAERLAAVRARTRALAESARAPVAAGRERSLVGRIEAIRGDTLYVRSGEAVVPLTLQPSTRVLGRAPPTRRPATPAARLRAQLQEGEEVRARFTVTRTARNLATTVKPAAPAPAR